MKYFAIFTFIGLGACVSPEGMYYEVTQRRGDSVSLQTNIGNMKRDSEMVADMLAHMDTMANQECQSMGKTSARSVDEWWRSSSPYYTWVERSYRCS